MRRDQYACLGPGITPEAVRQIPEHDRMLIAKRVILLEAVIGILAQTVVSFFLFRAVEQQVMGIIFTSMRTLAVCSFFVKVPWRASGQCSGSLSSSPTTLVFRRIW